MSETPQFNFNAEPVDVTQFGPAGDPLPPFRGSTKTSRDASHSGAVAIVSTWTTRQSAYLQVVHNAGALTDQEAAQIIPCALSSVNSVRGAINKRAMRRDGKAMLVPDGVDEHHFIDIDGQPKTTTRTRWRIRR